MKKILFLFLLLFCFSINTFADIGVLNNRIKSTTAIYNSGTSTLIQRNNAEVFSIVFVSTSSNGSFYVEDALTDTTGNPPSMATYANIKTEGAISTSGNSLYDDYTKNPLIFNTGLYLVVTNGYVIITYA